MLSSAEVIAFVATSDPERARHFYSDFLGLRFVADDDFALVFDLNGTMLRVVKLKTVTPAPYTVLGWSVPDIRGAVAALRKNIQFERYDGMSQDDLGVWTAPGGAKIAWFKDPDGNTLSLTEFAPSEAKKE